ncbi:efflux RND transporter periplasmic adaptor subunit [Massilia phyllosphaerae]|uniref:efflux RND transporter periplasmic adaptor subunit n=1 Tax=Massilia phyllosphaerae TaxID=3106034 RepID=UPI002B1CB218|nr:HlyD family efflux transporter periplasmic adaptor subunit [Massilia sp. SGZ-792]
MDVIKKKATKSFLRSKRGMFGVGAAVLLLTGYQLSTPAADEKLTRSSALFGKVRYGELKVQVDGYGTLRSDKQKMLTTTTSGTVEEILLKPGAVVKDNSIILRLSNPELEKQLLDEKQKLVQEQVSLRQTKLSQTLELLAENAKLEEIQTNYLSAKATRDEQAEWARMGVVSKLSFRATELRATVLGQNIEAEKSRLDQLKLVHSEVLRIQNERIAAQSERYEIVKAQHAMLNVRAGMVGVLQGLSVELGQSFGPGQKLALIGSNEDLIAMVKVPQAAAEQVKPGQAAQIDTRQEKVPGKVLRVNPAVENGTVMVEVAFTEAPPPSARLELNVDATIFTNTLNNVMYVERPVNARANATTPVFRVSADGAAADRAEIRFGTEAGRYIQVVAGVKPNDTVIVSDMSRYLRQTHVALAD